ncbi:uncharacterized protein [Miscanthus floridulus]|uniref:uncharacterized protein isoform X3 n=1 Tax=Miscanthus floridulus TaxID=154761 RepID=UPI003457810C
MLPAPPRLVASLFLSPASDASSPSVPARVDAALAPPPPMQAPRLRPPLSPGRRVSHACCRAGCRAELGGRHAAAPAATRLHLCPGLVHPNFYVAAVFDYIDAVEVCTSAVCANDLSVRLQRKQHTGVVHGSICFRTTHYLLPNFMPIVILHGQSNTLFFLQISNFGLYISILWSTRQHVSRCRHSATQARRKYFYSSKKGTPCLTPYLHIITIHLMTCKN